MTAERTAEEWGRVAVSLPNFPSSGMVGTIDTPDGEVGFGLDGLIWRRPHSAGIRPPWVLDVDHPATAGCLFALWGTPRAKPVSPAVYSAPYVALTPDRSGGWTVWPTEDFFPDEHLGRAAIAAAEALGRWPGGGA